ncbi:uncharacterized protein L3040_004507 [Drepanopeziza brunnea f. sp. 'multigermtubi']|uniref:uncharacterized protein n=1 Tax=Drepanopeziza brunnea f. sp. 'multigermtubi' TaxID=698441 RepID=UPI0023A34C44|nr:hypothetical protein L3040_004507 [Drepanopeziza brunnea f. sp. 'multigermtubi']
MFGFSFAKLDRRPPITFLVESNRKVEALHDSGGEIQLIRNGVSEVAWGFDVENVPESHYMSGAKNFASARHVQLKTLVLETHQKFSTETTLNEEHMNWSFDEIRFQNFRRPVKFLGDPADLTYPLDSALRISGSTVNSLGRPELKVVDNEEAAKSSEPIRNLIVTLEPQYISAALNLLKHRLRWDSTILFIQKGMMIQEMVNRDVFPDPARRPSYMIGTFSHNVSPLKDTTHNVSDPLDYLIEQFVFWDKNDPLNSRLSLTSHSEALLTISPVIRFPEESERRFKERMKNSVYITDLLLSAKKWLNTRLIDYESHRRLRYKVVAYASIVHPMTVMFNCYNRGVLGSDPDRKHVFQTLLNEAAAIIKHDDPLLDYDTLSTYIAEQVTNQGDNISPMLVKVARGKQTAIEWNTGAIMKRGMDLVSRGIPGIPFPQMHLDVLNLVHLKGRQVVSDIQDRLDEKAKWQQEIYLQQHEQQMRLRDEGALLPSKEDLKLERKLLFQEKRALRHDFGQRERRAAERRRLNPLSASAPDFTAPKIGLAMGNTSLGLDKDRWETPDKERWETGPMKLLREAREMRMKTMPDTPDASTSSGVSEGAEVEKGETAPIKILRKARERRMKAVQDATAAVATASGGVPSGGEEEKVSI